MVTFLITLGRLIKALFQGMSLRMIYDELPDTALLLDLCNGVYIARIQGQLQTEYRLYYQLIKIYRSPELLYEVSMPKDSAEWFDCDLGGDNRSLLSDADGESRVSGSGGNGLRRRREG